VKKKHATAIPDFSRKRPLAGGKPGEAGASSSSGAPADKAPQPNPRQPQKPPAKSKNGGRRGT
jgi:hypothetical protein